MQQNYEKEKREENIQEGKNAIEREFRRGGIELPEPQMKEFLESIAKKQHCNSVEDLYAAIGYGGVQLWRIIPRIKEDYLKIRQPVVDVPAVKPEPVPKRISNGVVIDGLDDCLIK